MCLSQLHIFNIFVVLYHVGPNTSDKGPFAQLDTTIPFCINSPKTLMLLLHLGKSTGINTLLAALNLETRICLITFLSAQGEVNELNEYHLKFNSVTEFSFTNLELAEVYIP